MCMRKRIATTSMVIVLLVCCVGVSNTKADDNNEYGILSNMGFSHSEKNGFENLENGNVSLSFSKNRDGKITSMLRKKARHASSYGTYIDFDERGRGSPRSDHRISCYRYIFVFIVNTHLFLILYNK